MECGMCCCYRPWQIDDAGEAFRHGLHISGGDRRLIAKIESFIL